LLIWAIPPMQLDQLRVFISSTFRDLQAERSYLVSKVFPEIRKVCRERGVEFTEIDLRWGLTHEDSALGRIIRTCFEEIDRCRPYFIGIVGSLYGWVPDHLELQKDAEIVSRYPWVEEATINQMSVLEMEMRYGVLDHEGDSSGAFFYIREPRPERDGGTDHQHLHQLEQAIRASASTVRTFTDPSVLGEQVRADLLAIIDRDFPLTTTLSPLERERRGHDAFAASRRRAYIAHPETINALTELALFGSSPVLVEAETGMGKSALLAHWCAVTQKRQPDAIIIAHYVGSTPESADSTGLVRRLMAEIADKFGFTDPIPDSPEAVMEALPLFLARTAGKRCVLVIDDVDKLDGRGASLAWLPRYLPPSVKLVVSAAPGAAVEQARMRGWNVYALQSLGERERETLLVRYLGEYRKSLSSEQCKRIAADPKCSNPLFLRTVLEELRVAATFEELDGRIARLLSASDLTALMRMMFARLEDSFGAVTVRTALSVIWGSVTGLTDGELTELLGFERARLSQLLIALDANLTTRRGRYSFMHEFMRRAVEEMYLSEANDRRAVHNRLAAYFRDHASPERRIEEEPNQWNMGGNREQLVRTLTDPLLLAALGEERLFASLRFWRDLRETMDIPLALDAAPARASLGAAATMRYDLNVGRLLTELGYFGPAREWLERALVQAESLHDADAVIQVTGFLINALYLGRDLERADEMATAQRSALAHDPASLRYLEATSNLASIRYARGHLDTAAQLFREALTAATGRADMIRQRATDLNNLASVLSAKGNVAEALALSREAADTAERSYGTDHPETAAFLSNLALLLKNQHRASEAGPVYERALKILTNVYGDDHPKTAEVRYNYANLLHLVGRNDEAAQHCRAAIATYLWSYGNHSPQAASAYFLLGATARKRGDRDEALRCFTTSLDAYRTFGEHANEFVVRLEQAISELRTT
jgi:nephrocystin-3